MNDRHPKRPGHFEDFLNSGNNGTNGRVYLIIATLNGPESVLVNKIPLHINNEQCRRGRWEVVGIWPSIWERKLDRRSHVGNPRRESNFVWRRDKTELLGGERIIVRLRLVKARFRWSSKMCRWGGLTLEQRGQCFLEVSTRKEKSQLQQS
jgi:hypothetical protein